MRITEWLRREISVSHAALGDFLLRLPGSPRREFLVFALSLGAGVAFGLLLPASFAAWLLAAALITLCAIFVGKPSRHRTVFIIAVTLGFIGLSRGAGANAALDEYVPSGLMGKSIVYAGTVENYPRRAPGMTTFTLDVLEAARAPAAFRLRVTAVTPAKLIGTETVRVTCTVKADDLAVDGFAERLKRQGIQGSCFSRQVEVLAEGSGVSHSFARFRDFLRTRVDAVMRPPEGVFLRGLLYGDDADFSRELRDDFRTAGVSHIVAVSGSNVSLMTVSLLLFVTAWWLPRKRAAVFVALVLFGFVLLVGFETSILRAAIMGSLMLLAKFLGRPAATVNVFLAAVVAMLFVSPNLLFSLAFQLTILATFAILFFVPAFEAAKVAVVENESLNSLLLSTVAVFLVTAPVISAELGTVSAVSLFSNLVILGLVPFATVLSLATLFAALMWLPLGMLIAAPTKLFLSFILYLVQLFAAVPHASFALAVPWTAVAVIEGCILLFVVRLTLIKPREDA